jgi:Zn-dependent protease
LPSPDIAQILIAFAVLLFSLTVHEAAHAITADRLGDPTARRLGRVSLNPAVHIDPIGTVLFPLIAIATNLPVIGWAKPVPVDGRNLPHFRRDFMLIAAAGPASNLVLATLAAVIWRVLSGGAVEAAGVPEFVVTVLQRMLLINVLLAVFNMIPIPPLDGSKILAGFLPNFWYPYLARMEQYAFAALLLLILFNRSFVSGGRDIIGTMYFPVFDFLRRTIVGSTLF